VVAGFAFNFVDAFPFGFFFGGRVCAWQGYFDFEAIERSAKRDATGDSGRMAMEAVLAGGDDGGFKLENGFISEACGIGKIARGASDGGDEALVRVQQKRDLVR
jgi:hypothetical protein